MKKLSFFLLASLFAFYGCSSDDDSQNNGETPPEEPKTFVLSSPDYEPETLYLGDLKNPDSKGLDSYGNITVLNKHLDKNKVFEFDCCAISYDNEVTYNIAFDTFTFTNCTSGDYSAITKKGVKDKTYLVVGASGFKEDVAIRFKDSENPKKAEDYLVKGLYITNSVYAYESMKDGTGYYGEEEIFGKDDSFKLTICNLDKTKKVEVYLAQGTNLLNEWKWVDLTSLGETEGLKFELKTTKMNTYGPITPLYFCLDGITVIEN